MTYDEKTNPVTEASDPTAAWTPEIAKIMAAQAAAMKALAAPMARIRETLAAEQARLQSLFPPQMVLPKIVTMSPRDHFFKNIKRNTD